MFDKLMSKAFVLCAALIVAVNVVVLTMVWSNRSETTGKLTLTERELDLPFYNSDENSGLSLYVEFRVPTQISGPYDGLHASTSPSWLDKEKMQSLGFTVEPKDSHEPGYNKPAIEKEVFVALEFNADSYQQMLANVTQWHAIQSSNPESDFNIKDIDNRLERETDTASRLFAIDAATELAALQDQYAGNPNIIFANALITTRRHWSGGNTKNTGYGYIRGLTLASIHVPYPLNEKLKNLPESNKGKPQTPRYEVDLEIGKSLEPFIVDVRVLEQ